MEEQLVAIMPEHVTEMRRTRTQAVENLKRVNALTLLPAITVPKLTSLNYNIFAPAFMSVLARTIGMNQITLDYITRTQKGNYSAAWPSQMDKLKNCINLASPDFDDNKKTVYSEDTIKSYCCFNLSYEIVFDKK